MRQFWKSYHVFLAPAWLKLLMYLGYPLVVLGVCGGGLSLSVPETVVITLASVLIITVENLLDLVVFEGIGAKDTNKLEYLKTSVRGMKTLRNSVAADAIRRAATVIVVLGSLWLLNRDAMVLSSIGFVEIWIVVFVTLGCTELGLMVTRSITMMMAKFLTIYLGATLCMWILSFGLSAGNVWGNACIACGLYLMIVEVGRLIIMRRARGSYYDK